MRFGTAFLALIFTLAFAPRSQAATLAEDTLSMLQTMKTVYEAEYAPADWKKKYANWDLNEEYAKAVAAVQARPNLTVQDTRDIFNSFIYSMRDYHVSIRYYSTEAANLPILVQGTDTQQFIVYVDRSKLSEAAFPFNVGDELVSVDGTPAADAVKCLQDLFIENVASTDKRQAELSLFNRRAAKGMNVPKGPVTLGIKRKGEDQVRTVQLLWNYTPEKIAPRSMFKTKLTKPTRGLMIGGDYNVSDQAATPYDMGGRKTFTPDLGTKVWESAEESTFHAYIFKNAEGKLVGYVRVPSYVPDDYKKAVADFKEIIGHFEQTTDSLVIDQVFNPGGSVFYLYALASMLSDKPLVAPKHIMSVDQGQVKEMVDLLAETEALKTEEDVTKAIGEDAWLSGYPVSLQVINFIRNFANFFIGEWNAGKKLTSHYWLYGVDHINPADVHYTKPILILVNEMDFSGGDFFPTILQDNKRVTVMGARTAGAGGYVLDVNLQNNVGIERFRITESLAERVNGDPIENLGVVPDIAYTMTAEDYQNNYGPYVKAVLKAVKTLTK